MKKTAIIFEHEGGRLGNQFWNHASILAYCLERQYRCVNLTFKDQTDIFASAGIGYISDLVARIIPGRIWNIMLAKLSTIIHKSKTSIVTSGNHIGQDTSTPFYLPPSDNANKAQVSSVAAAEKTLYKHIFFSGWLFRNPIGMMKYRDKIAKHFRPRRHIRSAVSRIITQARSKHEHIVGVHVRRGDYKNYWGGQFYNTDAEVHSILKEYLKRSEHSPSKTLFIICSDDTVNPASFPGLNVLVNKRVTGVDLFTLAACDIIIGSDSTFGAMAAYLGNIPIIFMRKGMIDWSPLTMKGYNYQNGSLNIQL